MLQPPLLLADEPTGSLDARTGEAVIELMFELNRERGSTLVLVTHDPDIARRCGRQVELHAGRIVSPGAAQRPSRSPRSASAARGARSLATIPMSPAPRTAAPCSQTAATHGLPRIEALSEQRTEHAGQHVAGARRGQRRAAGAD